MAFWVILYHVREATNLAAITNIIDLGYLGVDVFFVLSGYILTYVYFDPYFIRPISWLEVLEFVKKRFARIYPLHIATLAGSILFLVFLDYRSEAKVTFYWSHVVPQIFMTHAWGFLDGVRWNFPSWSISAEWFAYLFVFPFSFFLFKFKGFFFLMSVNFFVIGLFGVLVFFLFDNNVGLLLEEGIIRIIPEFLLGVTSYIWFRFKKRDFQSNIFIFGLLALMLAFYFFLNNFQFLILLSTPLVLVTLHHGNWICNVLFGNRIIVFLGEISYSIYMVHFFSRAVNGIIHKTYFGNELNSGLYFFNYIALTIVFSIIGYFFIEKPGRNFINTLKLRTH